MELDIHVVLLFKKMTKFWKGCPPPPSKKLHSLPVMQKKYRF